eukprot:gnl/TRDRNA2_/TRDRNA2_41802_c0_seq1.p1 gnl/TRDRNA2_/TRDRNA2_41802_c0~~gnl/TRDRNA2_/TRDRNA2_41802_c0_seq1.p1  ORF type:complete len:152 (-),score=19.26 gnl/TRDRNA2_/TRDRNA2_41802_c0_seq1:56-511(-)
MAAPTSGSRAITDTYDYIGGVLMTNFASDRTKPPEPGKLPRMLGHRRTSLVGADCEVGPIPDRQLARERCLAEIADESRRFAACTKAAAEVAERVQASRTNPLRELGARQWRTPSQERVLREKVNEIVKDHFRMDKDGQVGSAVSDQYRRI